LIARSFNHIGPGQSADFVVPSFAKQLARIKAGGEKPVMYVGDLTTERDFLDVRDVVEALIDLSQEPRAIGQVFNIGNPVEIRIVDLARLVIELCASNSKIEHVPFEQAYGEDFEEILRRVPDISKAQALINFTPRGGLHDILNDVIAEQRRSLRIPVVS